MEKPVTNSQMNPDEAEHLEATYWDEYARQRKWEEAVYLAPPLEDLEAFFEVFPGKRVLDVGCGWAWYVDRFLDHGLNYIGVDIAPAMIDYARSQYPEEQFELMSYRKLQFPDESFDGLWCSCAFSCGPKHNLPIVLQELRRVLASGGVMTIVMPCCGESYEETVTINNDGQKLHASFYVLNEFVELLTAAGFHIIDKTNRWSDGAFSVLVKK